MNGDDEAAVYDLLQSSDGWVELGNTFAAAMIGGIVTIALADALGISYCGGVQD